MARHRSIKMPGGVRTPTYQSWLCMRDRCLNPAKETYAEYGGRGIMICERWLASFENFLADMGERPVGKTLDRRDPDGNYEPDNCRWSTQGEQLINQRKRRGTRSKYRGVSVHESGRWRARIIPAPGAKRIHIGFFPTEEAAAIAYNGMARRYGRQLNPVEQAHG